MSTFTSLNFNGFIIIDREIVFINTFQKILPTELHARRECETEFHVKSIVRV